jgi:hypothetical protein
MNTDQSINNHNVFLQQDNNIKEISKSNDTNLNLKKDSDSDVDHTSSIDESTNIVNISIEEQDKKSVILHSNKTEEFIKILRSLPNLTPQQIRIIEIRYVNMIKEYKNRLFYIDFLFHFSRAFISIGGVAVPALLSIQSPTSTNSIPLYWVTWGISLCVTIFHNILTLFGFEKKYFSIHATIEKLESEGWHYLELSGRYKHHNTNPHSTYQNQFTHFTNTIEKIKIQQDKEEYNSSPPPDKLKTLPANNSSLQIDTNNDINSEQNIVSPILINKK